MTRDKIGIILSIGCLIHCILFPLIFPMIPLLGFTLEHQAMWHIGLLIPIVIIAIVAFIPGYRKHKLPEILVIAFIGICFLVSSGVLEAYGIETGALTVLGSLNLVFAHYLNHKHSCKCDHHATH